MCDCSHRARSAYERSLGLHRPQRTSRSISIATEPETPTPASTPNPEDEAAYSAAGLRTTARWIAAAFAGIPALTVVGALVRAPGDAGFDDGYLIPGVLLAALGAVVGILAFARVLEPIGLTDADISDAVLKQLPAARAETYAELRLSLEQARDDVGYQQVIASDAAGRGAAADAEAVAAEATVAQLEALLKDNPDPAKQAEATEARANARRLRAAAGAATAESKVAEEQLEVYEQSFEAFEGLRRLAYGLAGGEEVRQRYRLATKCSGLAVALVAVGVIFLAIAPKPEDDDEEASAAAPVLVTLSDLSPEGQKLLGCDTEEVPALQVASDEKTATVIVLPGGTCPVRTVKYVTEDEKPSGKLTKVEITEAE